MEEQLFVIPFPHGKSVFSAGAMVVLLPEDGEVVVMRLLLEE